MGHSGKVQGEGDYESAKKFDADEAAFVKSGRVDQAARAAAPKSDAEAKELEQAEQVGKSRAKEEDPALFDPSATRKPGGDGKK